MDTKEFYIAFDQWLQSEMREARQCTCLPIYIKCGKALKELYETEKITTTGSGSPVHKTGTGNIRNNGNDKR